VLGTPLEVDHIPEYDPADAHVERLKYDLVEGFDEKPVPFLKRPRKFAAVGAREKSWQRRTRWQHQLDDMHVAAVAQQVRQMREQTARRRGVDVMEQAVDEDEIEALVSWHLEARHIAHLEGSSVAAPRVADVALVLVDAEIVHVSELRRIGPRAAADIQDAADIVQIIKTSTGYFFDSSKSGGLIITAFSAMPIVRLHRKKLRRGKMIIRQFRNFILINNSQQRTIRPRHVLPWRRHRIRVSIHKCRSIRRHLHPMRPVVNGDAANRRAIERHAIQMPLQRRFRRAREIHQPFPLIHPVHRGNFPLTLGDLRKLLAFQIV